MNIRLSGAQPAVQFGYTREYEKAQEAKGLYPKVTYPGTYVEAKGYQNLRREYERYSEAPNWTTTSVTTTPHGVPARSMVSQYDNYGPNRVTSYTRNEVTWVKKEELKRGPN